ncbi:hypothetical protein BpHYR1_036282 [Brachionus plicatilis]|uniref:Uncharacterized protein n=1 Tax=Brachionus plicatilis TaxID=10195 RepID=A0A3M7P686_BRAPC|nr:hypothetical protein BpHYR1_036282 [Brachionus plicatilis]
MCVKADLLSYLFPSALAMPNTLVEIYKDNMMDNELKANLFKYLKAKKHSMIIGKRNSFEKTKNHYFKNSESYPE